MIYEKKSSSSGVAKAALATAIPAAAVSLGNAMSGCGGGILNLFGNGCGRNSGCCSDDHLVDRYTLAQAQEIEALKSQLSLRDANIYSDQKDVQVFEKLSARIRELEQQLCDQRVVNQKTMDSFQLVSERLQCCCEGFDAKLAAEAAARQCGDDKLEAKICCETTARKQADNSLVSYMNSTFYAKQVGTVSTTTPNTSQILYNPLPVDNGCCCDC